MDYRQRWQTKRSHERRRRMMAGVGAGLLLLVGVIAIRGRGVRYEWGYQSQREGPAYFVVEDDVVFCALLRGPGMALSLETGEPVWPGVLHRSIGFAAAPAVVGRTAVYVSEDGVVSAVSSRSGKPLWEAQTGHTMRCPPLISNGTVYVGCDDGLVYALALEDGGERWRHDVGAAVNSGFARVRGALVFGTVDGKAVGLGAEDGKLAWDVLVGFPVFAQPAVLGDLVVVAADSGRISLVDPVTGIRLVEADVPDSARAGLVRATPIAEGDRIYAATTDGWVAAYALQTEAQSRRLVRLWARRVGREVSAGPTLAGDRIYCADGGPNILALDKATGRVRSKWQCPARIQGSICVVGGLVIASTADGQVLAYREPRR